MVCPRGDEEAVFSSPEDRIRAGGAAIAEAGPTIVTREFSSTIARTWVRGAAESLFSVFFPSDCRICGLPLLNISRLPVCLECLASIRPIQGKVCSICGEKVLSSYAESDDEGLRRCPVCRRISRPFHRAVAYGSYEASLRELIHLLKYSGVRPAANVLGGLLAQSLSSLDSLSEPGMILVIPVPLYKGKRRLRGFNQAELIARAAMRLCPEPARFELQTDVLLRVRDTHSQIGLTSHQRRENLRGAFAVARAEEVNGREVFLVDDVYTTGTTASECARVLRRAGACRVWVATVARTQKMASKYVGLEPDDQSSENESSEKDGQEIGLERAIGA